MPACSKMAQKIMAAMKNTKTAARRWPSRSPRMENQTIAATGMRMKAARNQWKRGSSDNTVSAMTPRVPTMTSRLIAHEPVPAAGARPTCCQAFGLHHVGDEPERHADAGGAETPVPAVGRIEAAGAEPALEGVALGEEAGHQGGEKTADVDAHVEDGEAGVAALVAGCVEPADHGADVWLEQPRADRDQRQSDVERALRRHGQREMPQGDDAAADQHGVVRAEIAIGNVAAGNRQQVDGHRVVAVDARRLDGRQPKAARRHRRDDEQRQQRAHAVVGEALPQLRKEQRRQATRLPGKQRVSRRAAASRFELPSRRLPRICSWLATFRDGRLSAKRFYHPQRIRAQAG